MLSFAKFGLGPIFFLFMTGIVVLGLSSCSKDQLPFQDITSASTHAMSKTSTYCSGIDANTYKLTNSFGKFTDELIKDGESAFLERDAALVRHLQNNYSSSDALLLSEVVDLYVRFFGADPTITRDYWTNIINQKDFLTRLSKEERKLLRDGVLCYMEESSAGNKVFFSSLARWLGASCDVQVALGVIDTATSAAALAVSLPATGTVGVLVAIAGGGSTLASYGNTLYTALNC